MDINLFDTAYEKKDRILWCKSLTTFAPLPVKGIAVATLGDEK